MGNEDDREKSLPESGGNIDGGSDGNTRPTAQTNAVPVDASSDLPSQSHVEIIDPTASSSEGPSPPEAGDSHNTESSDPGAVEVLPESLINSDDGNNIAEDQGETILIDSGIIADVPIVPNESEGSSIPNTTNSRDEEKIHQDETDDSPFPDPVDIEVSGDTTDDQQPTETSSTEASSSLDELSAKGDSTEESSANSSSSSECDEEPKANEESRTDPDISPTDPIPKISRPSRRKQPRKDLRKWQEMPFPDTIFDLYISDKKVNWAKSLVDFEDLEDIDDDSPSRKEWLRQKREDNQKNQYMDQIMSIVGHEDVKAHFLYVKERFEVAKRWGEDLSQLKLDLILVGHRGVGKKQIAQIYAEFLYSIGYLSIRKFSSTGEYSLSKESQDDSVVFFSEADNIDQASEIDSILKHVNEKATENVLIFSYRTFRKSSSNALQSSPEARSRFPNPIRLDDFDEDQMFQLLVRLQRKNLWEVEGGLHANNVGLRTIARRAAKKNKSESQRNIHTLLAELDIIFTRQPLRHKEEWFQWAKAHWPEEGETGEAAANKMKQNERLITYQDIFGPEPTDVRDKSEAWAEIQKMIGLERVKKEISHLFSQATANYHRMRQGKEPLEVNLNRVFVGPPGVGKTTVARLYARILAELGLVSKGRVIMKTPTDLVGKYVGWSEDKTKTVLEEAMGNVLVIDDAHMLYTSNGSGSNTSDVFRRAVIDTLVAQISGSPGEDRCVILAGYPDEMETMFLNSNPGLQRRFPLEDALHFDGYNEDELCVMLQNKLARDDIYISEHGKRVAREVLGRMRIRPRFGNGGDVENLIGRAKVRQRERLEATSIDRFAMDQLPLEPEDFDEDYDRASRANEHRDSLFEGFVGFDKIIKQFQGYQQMADGMRQYDIDPRPHIPWAFVFKGPPGTGKTSTAKKLGRLFYDMGFLSSDDVTTCSVTDLVGEYCGQTGPKVIKQFELGLGKVLFIDEAYRLNPKDGGASNFITEAIGEIVDAMTKPRYVGNMVVILAGYTSDMEQLLDANQGLRSRFPTHISFPHMEPYHCFTHLAQQLKKLKIDVVDESEAPEEKLKQILRIFRRLSISKGWANGRDIETLARNVIGHVFMKIGQTGASVEKEKSLSISSHDLLGFLHAMLKERRGLEDDKDKEQPNDE